MKKKYTGPERRKFLRIEYIKPLIFKVCKKKTLSKLLEGYTSNISQSGIMCKVKEKVAKNDVLWLVFERSILCYCAELEKKCLVYQNGILGKVVRVKRNKSFYEVGIRFVTREEKNLTNIYPRFHFAQKKQP